MHPTSSICTGSFNSMTETATSALKSAMVRPVSLESLLTWPSEKSWPTCRALHDR